MKGPGCASVGGHSLRLSCLLLGFVLTLRGRQTQLSLASCAVQQGLRVACGDELCDVCEPEGQQKKRRTP